MKSILDEIKKFTPKKGFNVVAIDEYALPGQRLTLVGSADSRTDADKLLASAKQDSPGGDFAVYGPAGSATLDDEDEELARKDRLALGLK